MQPKYSNAYTYGLGEPNLTSLWKLQYIVYSIYSKHTFEGGGVPSESLSSTEPKIQVEARPVEAE